MFIAKNKNQGYIEYLIPFIDDASSKKDRDASLISDVHNNNGYLMLNTKSQKDIPLSDILPERRYNDLADTNRTNK